jgi:hypothetical protein
MGGLGGLTRRFSMGGYGRGGGGDGDPGMGGMGMAGPGGTGGSTEGVSTFQDTARLIELSVYGVASLYERFPPKPKQDGGTTPAPTTPTK